MVAVPPSLSGSLLVTGDRPSVASLCARSAPRGAWSFLRARLRSFSMPFTAVATGDSTTQMAATTTPTAYRVVGAHAMTTSTFTILIVVGGAVLLALVLALVYVLRVRRKVERLRRLTNVLGPELAPIPPTPILVSIDVAVDVSLPTPDHQRQHFRSNTPSLTSSIGSSTLSHAYKIPIIDVEAARAIELTSRPSAGPLISTYSPYDITPITPLRAALSPPPRRQTTDVDVSRGVRLSSRPSAGPLISMYSPYDTTPITPLRVALSPPPRRQTTDVDVSRGVRLSSRPSAGPQTTTYSPYTITPFPPLRAALPPRPRRSTIDVDVSRASRPSAGPPAPSPTPMRSAYQIAPPLRPPPARNLTIDVGAARAAQHTYSPSTAGSHYAPTRLSHETVALSPGPTSIPPTPPQKSARLEVDDVLKDYFPTR